MTNQRSQALRLGGNSDDDKMMELLVSLFSTISSFPESLQNILQLTDIVDCDQTTSESPAYA